MLASESGTAPAGHIFHLPQDVIVRIAMSLAPVDVERVSCTCKTLRRVMKDESVWQAMALKDLPKELTPSCWLQQQNPGSDIESHWPPHSYRSLLCLLQPFLLLQGLWKGSSIEQHTTKTTETILAFKWTPAALVCLQLKGTDSSGLDLYWTVVCVLSAKSLLPCVEELGQGIIAILPGKAKETEARNDDRERMHAALGASTHPLPGTSPSGSFESELLTFMRNTPPRSTRAARRSKRRRSNPIAGFGWPHGMHLRRAATPGQHGLRSLTGLWVVCACNSHRSAQFVEITLQIGSNGACLKGTCIGGAQDSTLFVAQTAFSLGSIDKCRAAEFWQEQGGEVSAAVHEAFLDSNLAAEPLTSWYTAPGGVETTRWSELVESLGLQHVSGSGEDGREWSPESSVDIVGLTNNMSLDGDVSEAEWSVQRVLTTPISSTENFVVTSVVEVCFSSAPRVVVLFGVDQEYQIMQRIDLP